MAIACFFNKADVLSLKHCLVDWLQDQMGNYVSEFFCAIARASMAEHTVQVCFVNFLHVKGSYSRAFVFQQQQSFLRLYRNNPVFAWK